ncbi:MAG: hypothetical protein LBK69_02775, partial [Syntrophomonadaceae bacterium]|nr:hypothetical protein [Syntrophomonadaceae bacterium]
MAILAVTAVSLYVYYGFKLQHETALNRNLTAQMGEFYSGFSDNLSNELLEAQQRKFNQLNVLSGSERINITLIAKIEEAITAGLYITAVEISEKVILSGTAVSYSDINQL